MNFAKYLYRILVLANFLSIVQIIEAQQVVVKAELDTNAMAIGDQILLKLSANQAAKDRVYFPNIKDTLIKGIDIIEVSKPDTQIIGNNQISVTQNILIQGFEVNLYRIPALPFIHLNDTLYSNPTVLIVNPIKMDSTELALIDTTQMIRVFDIKEPINTPWTLKEFLQLYYGYILGFLALVLVTILIIIYLKKRAKNEPFIKLPEKPKEPAHLIAFRALDGLKAKKLWQTGFEKEYYLELSDILRAYIENRYNIPTFERTSHELLDLIKLQKLISEPIFGELSELLNLSDLAKFAKYRPLPNENDLCLKNSYHIIEQTKLEDRAHEPKNQEDDFNDNSEGQDKLKDL